MNLVYLLLALSLLVFILRRYQKGRHIRQWKKALHLHEHQQVFQNIYQNTNGFILSQQARQKNDAPEYVYGEIEFIPFIALLSLISPNDKTIFYDLGCGTGKAVLACAMVFPVHQSVGVELFPELYLSACKQAEQLAQIANYSEQIKKIKFISGDFLETNLNDATLIFINSSALFGPTWEKLCERLNHLPHLDTVITTSKALHSDKFSIIQRVPVAMSWGVVYAYIHARKYK